MLADAKEKKKVPKLNNIDDMANFFDNTPSHELEWKDTDLKFKRPKMIKVSIRIPEKDLKIIQRRAARIGIGYTALMRMMLHHFSFNIPDNHWHMS